MSLAVPVVTAALAWAVARASTGSTSLAVIGAVLVGLMPAIVHFARLWPGALYPLPFALGWVWCAARFDRRRDWRLLAAGAFIAGLGAFAHPTAVVLMPLYAAATLGIAAAQGVRGRASYVWIAAAFVVPAALGLIWVARHPSWYVDHVMRYRIYDAQLLNPLQGVKDFANYNNLQERVSLYWDFYDPSYLFFDGAADMPRAARMGLLPVAFLLWLPAGFAGLIAKRGAADLAIAFGFVTAPAAAVFVDERYVAHRELVLIPFAVLTAVVGIHMLWTRGAAWRLATLALLVVTAIQLAEALTR